MIPLIIHSFFHVLAAVRHHPILFTHPIYRDHLRPAADRLQQTHPSAMTLATNLELMALPYLLVSIFSVGIVLPLLYLSFLRWQYLVSGRMRMAVRGWDEAITGWTESPSCPRMVRKAYAKLQHVLKSLVKTHAPVRPASAAARPVSR